MTDTQPNFCSSTTSIRGLGSNFRRSNPRKFLSTANFFFYQRQVTALSGLQRSRANGGVAAAGAAAVRQKKKKLLRNYTFAWRLKYVAAALLSSRQGLTENLRSAMPVVPLYVTWPVSSLDQTNGWLPKSSRSSVGPRQKSVNLVFSLTLSQCVRYRGLIGLSQSDSDPLTMLKNRQLGKRPRSEVRNTLPMAFLVRAHNELTWRRIDAKRQPVELHTLARIHATGHNHKAANDCLQ